MIPGRPQSENPCLPLARSVTVLITSVLLFTNPIAAESADGTVGEADLVRRALEPAPDAATPPSTDQAAPVEGPFEAEAPGESLPEVLVEVPDDTLIEEANREENAQLLEQRSILEEIEEDETAEIDHSELPEPCTGPWDWVHLSSGEWLRGEFKRMRKKSFKFRSTRMKTQDIKWKHIKAFCFEANTRFILGDRTVHVGKGRLVGDRLTVTSQEMTQTALRSDIWAMLPGLPTELNRWRGSVSAGVDAYTGNTQQATVTAAASLDRETPVTHLDLDYRGSFGSTDGIENVNRHRATGQENVFFNRVIFAALPAIDYTSDVFKNIRHRVIPGISLGYRFFDFDTLEADIQVGIAYQYTRFDSVQLDEANQESDVGGRLMANFDWDIIGDLSWKASHSTVLLALNFGQSNFHTQTSLVYDVTDFIYLEFSLWHDRTRDPTVQSDGTTPKQDDLRTLVSIGFNYD